MQCLTVTHWTLHCQRVFVGRHPYTTLKTMSKLLLALAALLALLALADAQCTGTYCCPCFCCDQTWNGRCNHWSPKVKCISDKRGW